MSQRLMDRVVGAERPSLMCRLVAGDPHMEATGEHMRVLAEHGADVIEILAPFSRPSYHGPVAQRACARALRESVTWDAIAEQCAGFRQESNVPVVVSTYMNRLLAVGVRPGLAALVDAGVDGITIVDLPWSESETVRQAVGDAGLMYVPVLSPTTRRRVFEDVAASPSRLALWSGHIGGEIEEEERLLKRLRKAKSWADRLVMIASMHVSTAEQAVRVADHCDGVLLGSSVAWLVEGRGKNLPEQLGTYVASIREALG